MPTLRQQIREYFDSHALPERQVEDILRAAREADEPVAPRKVIPWPRWTSALAMAAAVLLFAGLAFWMVPAKRAAVPFAALAPRVVEFFGAGPVLPKISQDKAEIREWLLAHGAPAEMQIPSSLLALESYACSVVDVQGRPAYLMCFWRKKNADGTGGELIHLLTVRKDDFRDAPGGSQPMTREMNGWSFASWSEGPVSYTLAAAAPMEKVRAFLASGPREVRPDKIAAFSF